MYLIFDIGGSSTKIGIIDKKEKIIEKYSIKRKDTLEDFLEMLENETNKAIQKYNIQGIGISSPGTVDTMTGNVGGISALEYIHTYNFAYHLQNKFNLPTSIENDANCSALSEIYFAKVKEKRVCFVVIGSGIGGAIVQDGEIVKGRRLEAGEFGYMLLKNQEGVYTNFSRLATLPNVRNRLSEKYNITESSYEIFDKYFEKEEPYFSEVNEMFNYLAMGLYNISYSLDPEVIFIGGAVSQSENFMREIKERLKKEPFRTANINLRAVKYFNDNNILGAYAHLKKSIEKGRKLCLQ